MQTGLTGLRQVACFRIEKFLNCYRAFSYSLFCLSMFDFLANPFKTSNLYDHHRLHSVIFSQTRSFLA
jgi:hypothetical protein